MLVKRFLQKKPFLYCTALVLYLICWYNKIYRESFIMKIFLLLLACFIISGKQVMDLTTTKNDLFLDKVRHQCFRYENTYIQFINGGIEVYIKENSPLIQEKHLVLHSVYTSSKAVYHSTKDEEYIGFVLIDSLLYTTKPEKSHKDVNFYNLFYFGMINPYNV